MTTGNESDDKILADLDWEYLTPEDQTWMNHISPAATESPTQKAIIKLILDRLDRENPEKNV